VSEAVKKRRFGFKRWIILALFGIGIFAAFIGPSILKPISPTVTLPAEPTGMTIFGFQITNTILATLIADVILILIALLSVQRFVRSGSLVPKGFYNAFEAIFEFLWNSVEGTTGKWAKRIFPIVGTIFLLIFVANMIKLVPGFESIGYLKEVHKGTGYAPVQLLQLGGLGIYSIDKGQPVKPAQAAEAHTASGSEGESHGQTSGELCKACEVVPFLRGSATDLNFTVALAVIAVVMSQVMGVMAQGAGYFLKFFNLPELISGGIFGMINFAVGILEAILEFAKILSFSFRLFGNIFAGALLLSIVGALTAVAVPAGLYLFEIFFGVIQAYVFFLLATVFMNMATVGHGGNHGEGSH
jgi:F-type H+-transporting ATPase subunit a